MLRVIEEIELLFGRDISSVEGIRARERATGAVLGGCGQGNGNMVRWMVKSFLNFLQKWFN